VTPGRIRLRKSTFLPLKYFQRKVISACLR
jgi:hypothetical protein